MSDNYLGEIRLFAGSYAPAGWMDCNGTLLSISQYDALYSLLGTIYGGDGRTSFALPDLRGRLPIGYGGTTAATAAYTLGQSGGVTTVTLTEAEMPSHNHIEVASTAPANTTSPNGALLADPSADFSFYVPHNPTNTVVVSMAADTVLPTGGGQAHNNIMPSTVMRYIIAVQGIFPTQA